MRRSLAITALAVGLLLHGRLALAQANVEQALLAVRDSRIPLEQFSLEWSDLHGLWGGYKITVRGTGDVLQEAVRRKPYPIVKLTPDKVRELLSLLIALRAWEQRQPQRLGVPDEASERVRIQVGKLSSEISEWSADLKTHPRIATIRDHMLRLAAPSR